MYMFLVYHLKKGCIMDTSPPKILACCTRFRCCTRCSFTAWANQQLLVSVTQLLIWQLPFSLYLSTNTAKAVCFWLEKAAVHFPFPTSGAHQLSSPMSEFSLQRSYLSLPQDITLVCYTDGIMLIAPSEHFVAITLELLRNILVCQMVEINSTKT
jgi:hypothetical protein